MRSEQEMLDLIVETARADERIRAVIMNGSRANPGAPRDCFQDFDIVYYVTDVAGLKRDPNWIGRFGELMILQLPDDMGEPPPDEREGYGYLMQFMDGNRIDLTLCPMTSLHDLDDSLSVLLLDKDGAVPPLPPASVRGYLPQPPTVKAFADCCNEFWWVCPYVAKGLWRGQPLYAKHMLDEPVRAMLLRMLTWYIGAQTGYEKNLGGYGKYFQLYLEPELWDNLLKTYCDAGYENMWEALGVMCHLFRLVARRVAAHFGFEYPDGDDARVSAHLRHVRALPRDAKEMY